MTDTICFPCPGLRMYFRGPFPAEVIAAVTSGKPFYSRIEMIDWLSAFFPNWEAQTIRREYSND